MGDDAPDEPSNAGGSAAGTKATAGRSGSGSQAGSAGSGNSGDLPEAGSKESHYPVVPGSTWTYHHAGGTKPEWDEIATIEATTYKPPAVEGKEQDEIDAFLLQDEEDAQGEQSRSTLVVQGSAIYRMYRESAVGGQVAVKEYYDPGFLRYDEALDTVGETTKLTDASRQECIFMSSASKCAPGAIKEESTEHTFKVLSTSVEVTVGAGKFDTVQIERVNVTDPEVKHFWYAKGVGKVRELDLGSNTSEELTEYHIP